MYMNKNKNECIVNNEIKLIKRLNINEKKWNDCIENSEAGTIYNYTYSLDALFPNWNALILGDYDFIFPITLNTKFRITYFFSPLFHSYFSIFSKKEITQNIFEAFIEAIEKLCSLYNFSYLPSKEYKFNITTKSPRKIGQYIDLKHEAKTIQLNYSKHLVRNLKKSGQYNLKFETNNSLINETVSIFKENINGKINELTEKSFITLTDFFEVLINNKKGKIFICNLDNKLLAIGFFSISNNRIIYHKGGNTFEGKKFNAMSALLNYVILKYSKRNLIFDFGGSEIQSVMRHNLSYGAKNHYYFTLKYQPFPFNLFNKLKKKNTFKIALQKQKK